MSDIYPLVIIKDRYNGTYSGGKWTAWNLSYVPSKIDSDDIECADFFSKNTIVYGRGETPQEAIDDLKMILNCGIPDPDEEDEDEEEEKMEPTIVWRIENIDDIWITQDVDGMSLMLKNKDDLTKIVMTGDAIDNFNDKFVISPQTDMIEYAKKMRKLEKENENLEAKSKEISDDNASLLATNVKLREKKSRLEQRVDRLLKENMNLREDYELLLEGNKTDLPKIPITDAMLIDEYSKLVKENKELKKKIKKLEQADMLDKEAADYWSKEHDILLKRFKKLQEENEQYKEAAERRFNEKLHDFEVNNKKYDGKIMEEILKRNSGRYSFDEEKSSTDNVNHPSHYTGKYECIDVMQDVFGDEATNNFCLCNAFKYIWRARKKNGLEDVKKAVWYLNKYIEEAEKDGEDEVTGT